MGDFARSDHPAVQAQLDRLSALSPGGDRLGLDRIGALLDRLGRPQDRLPPVFHVAGTNGKGSTCAFLRAALEAAGHSVHVFTSPHVVRFNERIRVAGRLIDDDRLASLLAEVLDASADIEPSFFEVTTAAAFLAFSRTPAAACIVEVGLGGRLDATNVIERPLVCGIASLGIDHQQFLGTRLVDIAAEKAGIAKPGVSLVTQAYPPEIASRIGELADAAGAPWLPRGRSWDASVSGSELRYRDGAGELILPLPTLHGDHQAINAALAIALLRHQDALVVPASAMAAGLRAARWPARLQRLGPGPLTAARRELWLGGCHNPAAAREGAAFVRERFTDGAPLHLLFACLASKDPAGILCTFQGLAAHVHTLPVRDHQVHAPEELATLAAQFGMPATRHNDLPNALAAVPEGARTLIFGSLYLAGEVLRANQELPD